MINRREFILVACIFSAMLFIFNGCGVTRVEPSGFLDEVTCTPCDVPGLYKKAPAD